MRQIIKVTFRKMKKTLSSLAIMVIAMMMVTGCGSTKDVPYFQNSDTIDFSSSIYLYDARVMPKDLLTITVSTSDEEAAVPFNLTVPTTVSINSRVSTGSNMMIQTYLVDNDGNIDFPRLGKIHVGGLTKSECEKMIYDGIKPFLNEIEEPIVTVRMANYKISVLGEVSRPGMYTVSNEKITILEALAQAGDLTIWGVRTNVKLVREDEHGEKSIHVLDLTDANIVKSPYYYLQQNDIVYVEPNKVKARNSGVGNTTTLWFTATSILVSLASLIVNIVD